MVLSSENDLLKLLALNQILKKLASDKAKVKVYLKKYFQFCLNLRDLFIVYKSLVIKIYNLNSVQLSIMDDFLLFACVYYNSHNLYFTTIISNFVDKKY